MLLLLGQLNLSAVGGSVNLVVSDALHAHIADSLTITTSSVLAIQEALHAHTADSLTITTSSVLAIQEALHAHTADSLTITTSSVLAIQESLHAHTADSLTVTISSGLPSVFRTHLVMPQARVASITAESRSRAVPPETRTCTV